MCWVKMPQLKGYKLEVDSIVIIPEKGESVVRLGVDIAREVIKRARQHWFSKTNNWRHNIQENLRQHGKIKTWPAIKLEIKEGNIEISLTHWLHRHKRPDPEKALMFWGDAIIVATGGIILDEEPARPEEIKVMVIKLIREANNEMKSLISEEPATPGETRTIIDQLAIESWVPPKDFNHK